MSPISTDTVVLGSGPAGLALSACLRRRGLPFELLERSERIADAWHRHYDRLCLHTTKETSHLPGMPFPASYPRYVPRQLLLDYLEAYRRRWELEPRLQEEATRVERADGLWRTTTAAGTTFASRCVAVATGFNRVPRVPSWPGQERFRGTVAHARGYRSGAAFRGREVLVVGMGNSGAEIALDLAEHAARPTISTRGPVNIVPRDVLGRPTQRTAMLLARLPERLGDALGVVLRRLTVGDLSRWGIRTPAEPPAAQLRRHGKTPVIDVGALPLIKRGVIRIRPGIEAFTDDGARFTDGRCEPFSHVVLATGYESRVGDFLVDTSGLLDRHGHPAHRVAPPPHEGLFFLGFDGYSVGGLLNAIRRDAEAVAGAIDRSR